MCMGKEDERNDPLKLSHLDSFEVCVILVKLDLLVYQEWLTPYCL